MYRNLRLIDVVVGLHCVGILGVSLPSSLMGIALKCLSGILARARAPNRSIDVSAPGNRSSPLMNKEAGEARNSMCFNDRLTSLNLS